MSRENNRAWTASATRQPAPPRAAPQAGFVHLHVHSSYSLREGAMSIGKLASFAGADAMPALAITDTNNLFGALEFSEKLAKAGIQPIIGIQLCVDFGDGAQLSARGGEDEAGRAPARPARPGRGRLPQPDAPRLARLARSGAGRAAAHHLRPACGPQPRADRADGRPERPARPSFGFGRPDVAAARLRRLEPTFERRLYVELQRHGIAAEREVEAALIDLAYDAACRSSPPTSPSSPRSPTTRRMTR